MNRPASCLNVCPTSTCGLRVAAEEMEGPMLEHIAHLAQTDELPEQIIDETNRRLQKQKPALVRQQKALHEQLGEVNAQAGAAPWSGAWWNWSSSSQLFRTRR